MVSLQAHLQTCDGGVRKSRSFLKDQLNSQLACLPMLFEGSAWVQCSQHACVYLQLQTVGVRKSRPFLKNQRDSQFACRQTVGVRKSRLFLKNQHAFNTVSLQVPLQPQTVRVMKSDPCLKDRLDSQFAGPQTQVQHSQLQMCLYSVLIRQSVCMSSDRWGQEVPTFLKNQHVFSMVSLQAHLQTCVNIQLQTGGVRESRPF